MEERAVALGESLHLSRRDHVLARASQDDDVGVVDHRRSSRSLEIAKGFGEEELALEASESGVALEKEHVRVAQRSRCGLDLAHLASDLSLVRGGVVLHLLAR